MTERLRLGVNIDHVATIRNARGGAHPEPLRAAEMALAAGADGVVAHLREDRRHIADADIEALITFVRGQSKPLNLEMAATEEMIEIALRHRPPMVMLVPERREERTTEGGLDVAKGHNVVAGAVRRLRDEGGARVSLFIEPDRVQVAVAEAIGAHIVELHTGAYCEAVRAGEDDLCAHHLDRLRGAAAEARRRGLEVHAGHGIDYDSVATISAIPEITELNIGHFLIGEAIFIGLDAAIGRMRTLMDAARTGAPA